MTRPLLSSVLACLLACACSSNTTVDNPNGAPDATAPGDGGTSDGDHGCSKACAVYVKAGCSSQTSSDCLSTCHEAAAKCPKEADATNACIPTQTVSCASDGLAQSDGCDAEFKSLAGCISAAPDSGTKTPSCTPHRASNDDAATCGGTSCPQIAYISTGGVKRVWCSVKCTSDPTCDIASGSAGVFGCDGAVCLARCTVDSDCDAISDTTGCSGGFCY